MTPQGLPFFQQHGEHMKIIIYLPLVTSALLLGWYLFGEQQPTAPATAPASRPNG